MDFISSKNIFLLTRDALKLMDKRLMKHGSRTAYIVYKMLECKGEYEKFELAEFAMFATLHDIGAYKTENLGNMLHFEMKDYIPHSVYGYLFLRHLSPMSIAEKSKIILYHHKSYSEISELDFEHKDVSDILNFAEKIDIYKESLGDKFNLSQLKKYMEAKFSQESISLFSQAQVKYDIFEKLSTEEYEQELDVLMDYLMFTNEEKREAMEMLMYCIGFRSKYKLADSVNCIYVCEEIAKRMGLSLKEIEKLYYGALIHDIGILAIPKSIINSKEKLKKDEMEVVRTHVNVIEGILNNRIDKDIVNIAMFHHERLNGEGYPHGIKSEVMNLQQQILQAADVITAMIGKRPYRLPLSKTTIVEELNKEAENNRLSKQVVDVFIENYDEILMRVRDEANSKLGLYQHINERYVQVYNGFKKTN